MRLSRVSALGRCAAASPRTHLCDDVTLREKCVETSTAYIRRAVRFHQRIPRARKNPQELSDTRRGSRRQPGSGL